MKLEDMSNFELMDKLIDKAIRELKEMDILDNDFTISSSGRKDMYDIMDAIPIMIMSYLRGYQEGIKRKSQRKG